MTLRELVNLIKFDVDQASLKSAERQLDGTISKLDGFGKRASLLLSTPIAVLAGLSINAAGQAELVGRRFEAVFAGLSAQAGAFTHELSRNLLYDEDTIKESMAKFQAIFVGADVNATPALQASMRMEKVLTDFVSFSGMNPEQAQQVLAMGLTGATRGLKQYGIVLKESAAGLGKNATEADKMLWRVAQIEDALRKQGATGAATRNINSYTDGVRAFKEISGDVLDEFGIVVLPVVAKFFGLINKGLVWLRDLNASVKVTVIVLATMLAVVGPLTLGIAALLGVVKAVTMFSTFMGGFAGLRGALVFALQPQFLLLAGVILVAVAALALFIEDITTWIQGGDSLTGRLLGPWQAWVAGLKDAFKLASEDFNTFVKALGIALVDGLADAFNKFERFVNNIFNFLDRSRAGRVFKFVSGIEGAQYLAGKAGTATGLLGTIPARMSAARTENRLAIHAAARDTWNSDRVGKQITVHNNIKLEVPQGTPVQQVEAVKVAADRAFQYGMSRELQRLLENQ